MAWTAPKIDWAAADMVVNTDLNEIGANLKWLREEHVDLETGIHGATALATSGKIIIRDAWGRAQVSAPSAEGDIAIKATVTAEAAARSAADVALQDQIDDVTTDYMPIAGGVFTGQVEGAFPDTDYTTAMLRNIKLMTTVPGAGDLENGEIAMVYEV
jgi:hypothetical protein